MATFVNCSFFSNKDVATSFLRLDHRHSFLPSPSTVKDLEELRNLLEIEEREALEWKNDIERSYQEAVGQSGKMLDPSLDRRNYRELKRVTQSSEGVRLFCNLLEEKTDPSVTESVRKRQPTASAQDLKKQRKELAKENLSMVGLLISGHQSVLAGVSAARREVEDCSKMPSLEADLMEGRKKHEQLVQELEEAEKERLVLLEELKELGTTQEALQDALEAEKAEIISLKQDLALEKENMMSESEKECLQEDKKIRILQGIQTLTQILEKIGGTQLEGLSGNRIIVKIRSGPKATETFHQVSVELDPSTMMVISCKIQPDITPSNQSVHGLSLSMALHTIKKSLLSQRAKNG